MTRFGLYVRARSIIVPTAAFLVAACQVSAGVNSTASPSFAAASTVTPSMSACALLDGLDISQLVGQAMVPVANSSGASVCTYRSGESEGTLNIAVRVEDSFADLSAVERAFTGGETIDVGDRGYWAPDVTTLWFSTTSRLYAVQILGVDDAASARAMAIALAQAISPRLSK